VYPPKPSTVSSTATSFSFFLPDVTRNLIFQQLTPLQPKFPASCSQTCPIATDHLPAQAELSAGAPVCWQRGTTSSEAARCPQPSPKSHLPHSPPAPRASTASPYSAQVRNLHLPLCPEALDLHNVSQLLLLCLYLYVIQYFLSTFTQIKLRHHHHHHPLVFQTLISLETQSLTYFSTQCAAAGIIILSHSYNHIAALSVPPLPAAPKAPDFQGLL